MKAVARNPEACALALLSCLLTFLPMVAPRSGLLLSVLAPFPLIVLGLKYPWHYAVSVLGLEAGILFLLEGQATFFLLTYYGVVPLVMAAALRREHTISQTISWSVVVPFGLSLFLLGVSSVILGQSPRAFLADVIEQAFQVAQGQAPLAEPELAGQDERLSVAKETLSQLVLTLLPAMLVINYLFTNVVNYMVVRRYCKWGRPPLHLHPEDIALWQSTDYLVWVFLAGGVLLLLPLGSLSSVGLNVFVLTLAIYFLQGVAIAVFWIRRLPLPLGGRWLLVLLALLLAGPLCIVACTAAGLFDLWVDFRRQRQQPLIS